MNTNVFFVLSHPYMGKPNKTLRIFAIILSVLTVVGLVADYFTDKTNFPHVYTLFPLCLLIITLLVMLVVWLFKMMTRVDR